ncbi:MAG: hypothetical protein GX781_05130 [Clostridiales bacterium]|nr:hypothetical protein [Clostridiales bacterium]
MQNKPSKSKKQTISIKKPYLKGLWHSAFATKRGFRILGYQVILVFIFLFIGQILMVKSDLLRIFLNLSVILSFCSLMYADGSRSGLDDVSYAEIALNRKQEGKQLTPSELARCYHPGKGFYSVMVGMLPFFILAVVFAVMTKEQFYSLGGLPSWVQTFERRADIGLALSYYHESQSLGFVGILRIIIRLLLFPYINMVGTESSAALLLLERLSPLLIMIIPTSYALGYLKGPSLRARVHGSISVDAKRRKRREKKAQVQRKQQPKKLV